MILELVTCRLGFDRALSGDPSTLVPRLRGALAARHPASVLLHQHDGRQNVYLYPRVQYSVRSGDALVTGLQEGGSAVEEVAKALPGAELRLGADTHIVTRVRCSRSSHEFGQTVGTPLNYEFVTPWIALNQENFERWRKAQTGGRRDLLRRCLVGNMLSMAKGLGCCVTDEISTEVLDLHTLTVLLKGTPMVGFLGRFASNFPIPDYVGLGKSVSRGFGVLREAL